MPSAALFSSRARPNSSGEGATSGCDGVAGGDRGLGLDIHDQAVEVGALTGTSRLDAVGDLEHGRVDRVDRDLAGFADSLRFWVAET